MAVPTYKRHPQKFGVLTKALDLASFTAKLCGNEKNFPKKYRWMLTQEIVKTSLNIATDIRMANAINVQSSSEYRSRKALQVRAYERCEALLTLIEVAWQTIGISGISIEHWVGMVVDVEDALNTWKKSDKERYQKFEE